ncbi:MAG TPA: maleylpyruvate isomerase family mycothiol-dependent enzyme [Acidimicrobiales bacterium]|jgi:uncharacterized protein (TIGR03083 family)
MTTSNDDTWKMIRSEREALVNAFDEVEPDDWKRSSLCAGWSNQDVLSHLVFAASVTPLGFFGGFCRDLVASGLRPRLAAGRHVRMSTASNTPEQLVGALRARVDAQTHPPPPVLSLLGETIVHGEDIFTALGRTREHPSRHLTAVADFYATNNYIARTKRRMQGITLSATDVPWTSGSGPQVFGPLLMLVLAQVGRPNALEYLSGPGLDTLRRRAPMTDW